MSGYYDPLTDEEYAEVTKLAERNLDSDAHRQHESGYSPDDLYDAVFSDTLEDVDGSHLWHLPAFQVSDVVADVCHEWQAKVARGDTDCPSWLSNYHLGQ